MPDLSLRKLTEGDYSLWDSFVDSSPQGTVFNTSAWASILREVFGVQHSLYVVMEKERLVGGISFFHRRKAGLKVITRLPLSPYNGILFHPPEGEKEQKTTTVHREILDLILGELENDFSFVHFALHPTVTDLRPFLWRHWYTLPQYTYINSLTDLDHTWSLFSSSLRRKIHRAEEKQLSITQKSDPKLLLKFQEMSYAKGHMKPILSFEDFRRFCEAASRANLLRVYSIHDNQGNVHAERALILHKQHVYDWIAGTNFQVEDVHANHMLVWQLFKRLSSEGFQKFDFLGANTPGVLEFKRSFGGELVCYFEVRHFSSWFVQTLNFLNQRWKRISRRA